MAIEMIGGNVQVAVDGVALAVGDSCSHNPERYVREVMIGLGNSRGSVVKNRALYVEASAMAISSHRAVEWSEISDAVVTVEAADGTAYVYSGCVLTSEPDIDEAAGTIGPLRFEASRVIKVEA